MTNPATAVHAWLAPKAGDRAGRSAAGWRCICCDAAAPWPLLTCGRFTCQARPKVWAIKGAAALRRTLKGGNRLRY